MDELHNIEVWIEQTWGRGHAELRIDDNLYGFWPDVWKRAPLPDACPPEGGDARFGGYAGDMRKRNIDQLAAYYNGIWAIERRELPTFAVFSFPVTIECKAKIKDIMDKLIEHPPEYHVLSKGKGKNCVTLAIGVLQEAGILEPRFSLPGRLPRPSDFRDCLEELARSRGDIGYYTKRIETARFKVVPEP